MQQQPPSQRQFLNLSLLTSDVRPFDVAITLLNYLGPARRVESVCKENVSLPLEE